MQVPIAYAIGNPEPIKNSQAKTVMADTPWGVQRLVIKPTSDDQQANPAWSFNEYMSARLGMALVLPCANAIILHGVNKLPLVGIHFVKNATRLKDLLESGAFNWNNVNNLTALPLIVAFDLCILNSDRDPRNFFLVNSQLGDGQYLLAYDHEKAFVGDGVSDLHRIKGNPEDKKLADFFQKWLCMELLRIPQFAERAHLTDLIVTTLEQYTKVLEPTWELYVKQIPSVWTKKIPLTKLSNFLQCWWRKLPSLALDQLPNLLDEKF